MVTIFGKDLIKQLVQVLQHGKAFPFRLSTKAFDDTEAARLWFEIPAK